MPRSSNQGDIRIWTFTRNPLAGPLVKPASLKSPIMLNLYKFGVDFLLRQRIPFRIDFYVRQQGQRSAVRTARMLTQSGNYSMRLI